MSVFPSESPLLVVLTQEPPQEKSEDFEEKQKTKKEKKGEKWTKSALHQLFHSWLSSSILPALQDEPNVWSTDWQSLANSSSTKYIS